MDAAYARYAERIADLPPVSEGCAEEIAENLVWVTEFDGEIVGGIVLMKQNEFMKLANVAVHPTHAGKGLGRELIAHAEAQARKLGYSEMRLNTHVKMPENIEFYTRLGWNEVSRIQNTVSMQKRIS